MVEPILAGAAEAAFSDEDLAYVRDLGLVAPANGGPLRLANPIYAEVVPRHLRGRGPRRSPPTRRRSDRRNSVNAAYRSGVRYGCFRGLTLWESPFAN